MGRFGTVSCNIYCNFTNYGSALQTWALHQAIKKLGHIPVLVDYCPDKMLDKDPLNPFCNMWDQDAESKKMVELTMPAIRENYWKFDRFFRERFTRTKRYYTSKNFNDIAVDEALDGYVCGSDTIFCLDEFGVDEGYYANYDAMKKRSVSYAASFGDSRITDERFFVAKDRLSNFLALGIRENQMIPIIKDQINVPVQRTIDPTLLLSADEYDEIVCERDKPDKYLLIYSRRYSPIMEAFADRLAKENHWKIVDISLRAVNAERGHEMAYSAGVEEFLGLIKNAEFVVTNSFHGTIFSVLYRKPFTVFSREQSSNKIRELLQLFGLQDRMLITGEESFSTIDYQAVHDRIAAVREASMEFLKMELDLLKGSSYVS